MKYEIWNLKYKIWNPTSNILNVKYEIWNMKSEIWNLKCEIWNLTSEFDGCDYNFLPPAPCCVHKLSGFDETCPNCRSAAQPGVFAVKPLTRTFRYYYDPKESSKYINVQRKQFPLMPAPAMPLYSMQGTTADPGMVAYWFFPQRCTPTIKWLIVYVMLSRPRSLAGLRSVGLTTKVKEIIEQGPPEDLVSNFKKLFDDKMRDTKALAMRLAKEYDLLPGRVWEDSAEQPVSKSRGRAASFKLLSGHVGLGSAEQPATASERQDSPCNQLQSIV